VREGTDEDQEKSGEAPDERTHLLYVAGNAMQANGWERQDGQSAVSGLGRQLGFFANRRANFPMSPVRHHGHHRVHEINS
jgi:hypothetical protein